MQDMEVQDVATDESTSCTMQSLCDENRMLGNSLRETVTNLEKKKIQLIAKRDQLHAQLNWHFEKVSTLKSNSEQLVNDLERTKSELSTQVLKREQLEQKNELIDKAFSAQLAFQQAINKKFEECEEDLKSLISKEQQTVSAIESDWHLFNTQIDKYVEEDEKLKIQIKEERAKQKIEIQLFYEKMKTGIAAVNKGANELKEIMMRCENLKTAVNELPIKSYQDRISEAEKEKERLQEEIVGKKMNFAVKIAEIDRKKEEKEMELKQLQEQLSEVNDKNVKLSGEIQKAQEAINEKTRRIEHLTASCDQKAKELAERENELRIKEEQKNCLRAELNDLEEVEESNVKLRQEIEKVSHSITMEKEVHAKQMVDLDELSKERCHLSEEIVRVKMQVDSQSEENVVAEQFVQQLQTQMDDFVEDFNQRKRDANDNIEELKSSNENVRLQIQECQRLNNVQLDLINGYGIELQQLNVQFDEKVANAEILEKKLKSVKQANELDLATNQMKLQEVDKELEKVENEIHACNLVIHGDLSFVPEEYDRLVALEANMKQAFEQEKQSLTAIHSNAMQQVDAELRNLERTYEGWFEGLDKKAAEVKEELKKQAEKNSKYESQSSAIQTKIKHKEKMIEDLQNQVVRREVKLQKARNAAVFTTKDIGALQ